MARLFKSGSRKLGAKVKPKNNAKPQNKAATKPRAQVSEQALPEQLSIVDLVQDGRGVARHHGKTVFVAGALPGECVSVMHYRHHKRFDECQVRALETRSTERIEPVCPHFGECGGCQLQHLQADAQLRYKQAAVLALLQRQAGIVPSDIVAPIESPATGYRTRARLAVSKAGQLAFRREASEQLVPIGACSVQDPRLESLLKPLQCWLNDLAEQRVKAKPVAVTHIEMIAADSGVGLVLRHPQTVSLRQRGALRTLLAEQGVQVWWQAEHHGSLQDSDGIGVDPVLEYRLTEFDLTLAFKPANFTQVNAQVNQAMVSRAVAWLNIQAGDHVADLFCGIGNFTLPLARRAKRVVGIEAIEAMVQQGRANALSQGLNNAEFQALDLAQADLGKRLAGLGVNKLLLDPPRSGAREVCEEMRHTGAQSLVYVSCNPASLVRDAAILHEQGYRLEKFCVLDMFPHTAHVESMALFLRG